MKYNKLIFSPVAILLVATTALGLLSTRAYSQANFYEGKTVTLIAFTAVSTGCSQPTQFSTRLPRRPASSFALNDTRLSSMRHTISAAELGRVPAASVFEVVTPR